MSLSGQTRKSGLSTGSSALPSIAGIVSQACQVRKVPIGDTSFDGLTTSLRDFGRCLTRLEQHPYARSEKGDTRNPCNHTA